MADLFSESDPIMPIGVVARKLGVSVSTIRLYEKEGLLGASRSASGRRLYSMRDVLLAVKIRELIRHYGLNFAGVRAFFSGIPCWEITDCPPQLREKCSAYTGQLVPCWSKETKGCARKGAGCLTCPVYTCAAQTPVQERFAISGNRNPERR